MSSDKRRWERDTFRGGAWVVYCAAAGFESEPMTKAEAEDMLESGDLIHPFQGACVNSHDMAWVPE
jgi:hypothetical protein